MNAQVHRVAQRVTCLAITITLSGAPSLLSGEDRSKNPRHQIPATILSLVSHAAGVSLRCTLSAACPAYPSHATLLRASRCG